MQEAREGKLEVSSLGAPEPVLLYAVGFTLSATTRPFQPQAALLPSREDDMPQAYPIRSGLAGGSPTPGLSAGSPVKRTSLSHHHSSDDDGISTDTSISDQPLCRRHGSRGS